MANMSEAFGNITIFCASFDALVDLIQCHLKYEKEAYYSFDDCLYNIGDNGIALLEEMGLD